MVNDLTWQTSHPILSNNTDPLFACGVSASFASRAGALEVRMNRANRSTSESPSGPGASFGSDTVLQRLVTSSGNNRFVMPISFR